MATVRSEMAKIWIDIDETLLAEAAAALGTTDASETATKALRLVLDKFRSRPST